MEVQVEVVELPTAFARAPKLVLAARRVERLLGHLLSSHHTPLAGKLGLVTEFAKHHLFSCLLRPYTVVVQEEEGVRRSREVVAHLPDTVHRARPARACPAPRTAAPRGASCPSTGCPPTWLSCRKSGQR